jgi:4-amino-4-deoxy-L-arabinose transferase-like glycosyltransferase
MALAVVAQAWAFQLLAAGPVVQLQLFLGWRELLGTYRLLFLVGVETCALAALAGAAFHCRAMGGANTRAIFLVIPGSTWTVLLALQLFAAIDFTPSDVRAFVAGDYLKPAAVFAAHSIQGLIILLTGGIALWLAAAAIPSEAWERCRSAWKNRNRRALPLVAALWVLGVSSLLAWMVFERVPHLHDEVAYEFHAKYLATGQLYLEPPPEPHAFDTEFNLQDGRKWYMATTPGWPAVLALGYLIGAPWLINPLLGGIAILLAHAVVRRLYDEDVADGTALLLAGSPWLLFLSASLMPHPLTLVLSALGLLGAVRARNEGSAIWAGIAGLAIGAMLHVRPLDAVILAVVAGVWWLSAGWRRLRLVPLVAVTIAGLAMTFLFLAYNRAITGDPFYPPINKFTDTHYYPGGNRLGFGKDIGNFGWTELDPLPGHGPRDVFVNTNINLYMLNFELFGWPCGSLAFVFLLCAWRRIRDDLLMWGFLAALWAGLSLYWFSGGPDFGPRYWYQMILPCAVLTIRGAQEFASRWSAAMASREETGATSWPSENTGASRVWAFVALASLVGTLNLVTWRSVDKYYHYRGMRADVRALAAQFGRSLVFVQGKQFPDYAASFVFNPPGFGRDVAGPIFARDLGAESRERLAAYYSDRPLWIVAGPSETGGAFRIVAGPLPPKAAAH